MIEYVKIGEITKTIWEEITNLKTGGNIRQTILTKKKWKNPQKLDSYNRQSGYTNQYKQSREGQSIQVYSNIQDNKQNRNLAMITTDKSESNNSSGNIDDEITDISQNIEFNANYSNLN